MKPDEVVAALLTRHVQLSIHDGDLCLRVPEGAVTQDLREALRAAKPEIVSWIGEGRKMALASFTQQRLWFLHQLDPEQSAYHIHHALRIKGHPDAARLEAALNAIVARHESLRTRFLAMHGNAVQIVEPSLRISIDEISVGERDDLEGLLVSEACRPFSLESGPLLRALLFRVNPTLSILLLVVHHAVFDGWSSQILLRELGECYAAPAEQRAPVLPPITRQFLDYAAQQRHRLDRHGAESLKFWKRALAPPLPVLQLPSDFPRPAVYSYRGARVSQRLDDDLVRAIHEAARRDSVTPFVFLLAAYQVLLFRYTGERDILVGSPVAGRDEQGLESLIGFFANTIVLRTRIEPDDSFANLLARVRATALDAQRHQDVPFERIVEMVQPVRSRAHTPVFQVMFALQNMPREHLMLEAMPVERMPLDLRRARFDVTMTITQRRDGLVCHLEYSEDLFERPSMDFMLRHYVALLQRFAEQPQTPIGEVSMISPEDQAVLVSLRAPFVEESDASSPQPKSPPLVPPRWGIKGGDFVPPEIEPFPATACDLLRAWNHGNDGIAAQSPLGSWNYSESWAVAASISSRIHARGCSHGAVVAVCMEHSHQLVAALVGVWHAGCVYLPIDPTLPASRIQFMLRDANVALILADPSTASLFPDSDVPTETLDEIAPEPNPGEATPVDPNDIAYIIYTSGSTGTPKGVLMEHRGICNTMAALRSAFGVTRGDRVLFFASIAFDASLFEMLLGLGAGATVVTAPRTQLMNPETLAAFIERERITAAILPPAMLAAMPLVEPPCLRVLISGGDVCSKAIVDRWAPGRAFFNAYGPTEVSIWATAHRCEAGLPIEPPIGRPIQNMRAYVLDNLDRLVPIGVPGELVLAGVGVGRGYLNRPDETDRAFVVMPSLGERDRVYRTGDLVRVRHDATLQYLGRRDGQVKLRGYRIELGEIEHVLETHPAVRAAAVIQFKHNGSTQLTAFLAPATASVPAAHELRAHVTAHLPAYMAPSQMRWIDPMPMTPSGKVDRIALSAYTGDDHTTTVELTEPRDAIEVRLSHVWQRLFPNANIHMQDDFFELGGHSLLAVRLMADVEREFGCKIPLPALFEAPTVEGLARVIRQGRARREFQCVVPLQPKGLRPPFFCVHPAPGTVFCYLPLAHRLGDDQPFYGIQAQNTDGEAPVLNDVKRMAAAYLEEVRRVQPQGPYYLGGHSAGALIAFEMAQQLARAGQQVGLVAIIDAIVGTATDRCVPLYGAVMDATDDALWLGGFYSLISQFFNRDARVTYAEMALLPQDQRLEAVLHKLHEANFLPPDSGREYVRTLVDTTRASYRACWTYIPKPYSGDIAVFRRTLPFRIIPEGGKGPIVKALARVLATNPRLAIQSGIPALLGLRRMRHARKTPDAGWQSLTSVPVTSTRVEGNHISMLREPYVQSLANALQIAMESAMKRADRATK